MSLRRMLSCRRRGRWPSSLPAISESGCGLWGLASHHSQFHEGHFAKFLCLVEGEGAILRHLENPTFAGTPLKAVQKLRQRGRYLQRAPDLGIVTPDASVLLRANDMMMAGRLEANSRILFRISLMRYNLQVDLRPTSCG